MRRFTAAFGIGLLLLSAFEWTLGTRWWLAAAVMVFPHEVLIGPAMALVCATARDRAALLANLLSLSWLVFGLCGYNVAVAAPREGTITVASLNIHHASYGVDRVRRALEQCDASVICLQEAGLRHLTDRLYPGGRTGWNLTCAGELAILSRYLVIRTRVLNMGGEGRWRPLVAATLDVNGRSLTVINVHYSLFYYGLGILKNWRTVGKDLSAAYDEREHETRVLLETAAELSGPILITGDFNASGRDRELRAISAKFQNAFNCSGWGFGHTYHAQFPVIRLDYAFASPELAVSSCEVMPSVASDHRALRTRVSFR